MTIRRAYDHRPLVGWQRWTTRILATAFGFGYSPFAPGTAGTIPPLLVLVLWQPARAWGFLGVAFALYIAGALVSTWGERLWERSDPGHVCIDEVVGYLVSVAFVPAKHAAYLFLAAFFLFRFFDIVKPPPARLSERLPSGWGIMTDDVVAGIYSNLALQIAAFAGWL